MTDSVCPVQLTLSDAEALVCSTCWAGLQTLNVVRGRPAPIHHDAEIWALNCVYLEHERMLTEPFDTDHR
jgi:hypothetical protein